MKISLIQPSRNNLKYLSWAYDAIRKNQGGHEVEICVADDASTDGTWEWCQEKMQTDPHFKAIRNEGPERLGHTILYDRLVNEVASHDLCMIYHADMYLCPGALDAIENLMYNEVPQDHGELGYFPIPKRIISLTRIEPPLHPPGPEKLLFDCGTEPEDFHEETLMVYLQMTSKERLGKTTTGVFAPWAFWKSDFQEIGGHDPLYAPQSKEDSDIFNRFQLNGVEFIQTWEGCVYHMTCRGSRFNPTLTTPGQNSFEWDTQNIRSTRNFIRKWGHFPKHDEYMKPIIPPKYDIGFIIENCHFNVLHALEPWCSKIYVDCDFNDYIKQEQSQTDFDLKNRVFPWDYEEDNDIIVNIDAENFNANDFINIQRLSEIIQYNQEKTGEFQLGNLIINVYNTNHFEKDLIFITNNKNE